MIINTADLRRAVNSRAQAWIDECRAGLLDRDEIRTALVCIRARTQRDRKRIKAMELESYKIGEGL